MSLIMIGIYVAGMIVVILVVLKISSQVNQQLNTINQQVNERLRDASLAFQDAHRTVGERLDSATKVFGDVQKSLGRLEQEYKQIYEVSKNIAGLQELLRAPKFRGEMGQTLLGKLLEEMLPKENIKIQYRFKSGDIVDAAIVIGQNLVPVDAKFPWENFKKFSESNTEVEKKSSYRAFLRDVKNRIDEIASKYILPDEGTFDFAMMYIPAEAVYYQINRDEEICSYAKSRKIVVVSPNTFYAYLQAILYGLRGMNIQRNIQKIFADLGRLQVDFKKFQGDFDLIGSHLSKASSKYNEARVKLGNFTEKLTITAKTQQIKSNRK